MAQVETKDLAQPTEEVPARSRPDRPSLVRLPTAAWVCFAVALLNGIAWGLVIPIFQTPDEPAHVAYAQYVAETGRPPTGGSHVSHFSEEESRLLSIERWKQVQRREDNRVPGTASYHKNLEQAVGQPLGRESGGGYTSATNNPPLYYYGAAAVYHLTPSATLPDRIHAMRLLSALLAAITVLFVFLFLRELLPGTPWAWPVGALAVAFQPMFGFTSSGVTSDSVLYAASAGTFYLFALSFRRGLTQRRGIAIGALAAVGLLSKTTMLGLAPGIAIGLCALVLAPGSNRREAARGAAAALAVAGIPVLIYVLLNSMVWDRGVWFGNTGVPPVKGISVTEPGGKVHSESAKIFDAISYVWQFYLPRLPSMHPFFQNYQLRNIWFDGFLGQFGWLELRFPGWVYNWSLVLALGLLALAARAVISVRKVIRSRLWELSTYLALALGLLVLVASTGYLARLGGSIGYEQPRYLFPLLPLYGALIALAACGVGRRYAPAAGVLFVCLAIAHTAASYLLVLNRYYG